MERALRYRLTFGSMMLAGLFFLLMARRGRGALDARLE
jgi:hypothetical protein